MTFASENSTSDRWSLHNGKSRKTTSAETEGMGNFIVSVHGGLSWCKEILGTIYLASYGMIVESVEGGVILYLGQAK
jgi:hypothetical protein